MTHGPCNCVPHVSLWKVLATRALDACTCRWCSHALDTWALEITCPHGPSGVVSLSGTDAVHSCRPAAARPLCPSCRALRMMVLPLVAGCIAGAVCSLREAGTSMGSIATWTLSLFLGLTFCAALLGVVLGAIARPGRGRPFELGGQSSGCLALTTVLEQQGACSEYGSLPAAAVRVLTCLPGSASDLSTAHGPCACRSVLH